MAFDICGRLADTVSKLVSSVQSCRSWNVTDQTREGGVGGGGGAMCTIRAAGFKRFQVLGHLRLTHTGEPGTQK